MILTYTTLPFISLAASLMTYLCLKHFDPVNLEDYKDQMNGIPPIAVCITCIYPVLVLLAYDFFLKLGVKPSKTGIKM